MTDKEDLRPRQSGMEHTHERIVCDLLNFLHGLDIPFFKNPNNGVRGGTLSIPERLNLVKRTIDHLGGELAESRRLTREQRELIGKLQDERDKAQECLLEAWDAFHPHVDDGDVACYLIGEYLIERGLIADPSKPAEGETAGAVDEVAEKGRE